MAPNDRASRRLMTRLAARQRLQREGGTVRRLRERETVAFRRALYRSGTRVRGVAGVGNQGQQQQQRDITAESFRRNPVHLNRLRPWLRRELTVLYGAHGSLVDIVQRIIMARLARHGLEDTPTIEDELRPFLLARTDHFLHELISFARSPLSLENYDVQAVYEPPATALELDGTSSSTDSSSVIAISEGEEEEPQAGGRSEERPQASYDDLIQTGSSLSLAAWDDETPGPSYSSAEPSCSLAPLSFSPAPQQAANEEGGEKQEDEEGEEECLIVGYKKPIAERTPELVQLSSDTEEDKKEEEEDNTAKLPPIPTATPPLSYLPIIPPSTSAAYRDEQDDEPKEKDGEAGRRRSRVRSWSGSSGKSRKSVCTLSPSTPGDAEQQPESECWRDRKQPAGEAGRERRRRKRSRRGRERSGDRLRKSGTLYNPNRSIYPAMMRQRSHSPSPLHSSVESAGSPLPPSPADSGWEYHCSLSPLTSSISSPSSSPLCSSPQPSSQTPPMPSLSPRERSNAHHGEKPGGKRKYKSRHLDSNDKDPTWRPSSSHRREKRRERREKERRRTGRDDGRRRERQRRDSRQDSGGDNSRRSREDRSPSVEIIYEGTIASNAAQPPARKRRRKRHRKTPHSSSPVIITLDSDSSHHDKNNNSSGSSTPLSSQQTVDFSDLPPLTLVHAAGVGRVLNAEIGELPVDILDRGSDGSETQSVGRPESAGPIAIDNSDNSDHDVDVEKVEDGGSLLRLVDDKGPMREALVGGSPPTGRSDAAPTTKRDSEVPTSDSRLLATILNDLKGIGSQKRGPSLNCGSNCSSHTGNKRFRGQCEIGQGQSNHSDDDWPAETRHPDESRDQNPGFVLPTARTCTAPLPPVECLKDYRVREEVKDVPPLLTQASPVRLYSRNTPPPLKHRDAGSPHQSPVSPIDLRSPHTEGHSPVDMKAVDLKEEPDVHSSCHAATSSVHSTGHGPPIDARSGAGPGYSSNADRDFSCSRSSELHSSCEASPRPSAAPAHFHRVLHVHSAKNKPAHTDSTSRGRGPPADLHPPSSVSAGRDVSSGANCTDTSPSVGASSDSGTRHPSSSIDSRSSGKMESGRFSPSEPAAAPCSRLSPADGLKSTVDSSSATSEGNKALSLPNHEVRLPPIVPPANKPSPFTADQHLNHSAVSSSSLDHPQCRSDSNTHVPAGPCSKLTSPADSGCHSLTDNHITPSPQSAAAAGTQWDSSGTIDAQSHSASVTWSAQTHSSTYDT